MASKKSKWHKCGEQIEKCKATGICVKNDETKQVRVLLTPHGRYQMAVKELETGMRYTNDGKVKKDKNGGNALKLTPCQRAFRAGQRSMVIEQTKAYKAGK